MKKEYIILFLTGAILIIFGIHNFMNTPSKAMEDSQAFYQKTSKVYTNKFSQIEQEFNKLYTKYKGDPLVEKLHKELEDAKKELKSFNENSKKLTELVKNYDSSKKSSVISTMEKLNVQKRVLSSTYNKIDTFIKNVEKAEKEKPKNVTDLQKKQKEIDDTYNKISTKIEKAKKDFPNKKTDLEKKDKKLYQIKENFDNNVKAFMKESNPIKLVDILEKANKDYDLLKKESVLINKKVDELYKDYSKILIDMKERPYIQIGRTSWDDAWDFPTEHDYIYPKKYLTDSQFKYFQKIADKGSIGTLSRSLFSSGYSISPSWGVDKSYINSLKINPVYNFPSRDDSAEYWINDLGVDYFHKYKIINNGKVTETDWVKVPEDFYYKHIKDLGMAIVTKPKGYYEEETIKVPTPPGMAYVGNPHYGEWKQDSNGHSFWHYYGMYSFFSDMLGGSHYSRNEYDSYRRNYSSGRGYYGNNKYGTGGTVTSRTLGKRSSFYRSNSFKSFKKGGFKSSGSFRNIGSKIRGRGPSGGGK